MLTTAPVAKGQICGICDKVNDPIECSSYQTCQPTEVSARQNFFFYLYLLILKEVQWRR